MVGLTAGTLVELQQFHPTERLIGHYRIGQTVTFEALPIRSLLLMATTEKQTGPAVEGCDYEIVRDVPGKSLKINLLGFPGEKKMIRLKGITQSMRNGSLGGKPMVGLSRGKQVEVLFPGKPLKESYHRKLGNLVKVPVLGDAEVLYEATCFVAGNNALEVRSLARSGLSSIPEVQKAREAFFGQDLFSERGLWDRYLFDGDPATAFYPGRRWGIRDIRINGGALRLDLGGLAKLDGLRIILGNEQSLQPFKSWEGIRIEVSADLKIWTSINVVAGKSIAIPLDASKPVRFVRLPGSPERIAEIEGFLEGKSVDRSSWRASNLFSTYRQVVPKEAFESSFVLNEIPKGSYLAIEGAYAAIRVNGKPVGAPDRSPSYHSNTWEYPVPGIESNYTYYIPLTPEMVGAKIDASVIVLKNGVSEFKPEVWITAYPAPFEKLELELPDTKIVQSSTGLRSPMKQGDLASESQNHYAGMVQARAMALTP
jgi:hypothetical protein